MIAILKQSASDEAVSHIVSWIEKKGLKTDVSARREWDDRRPGGRLYDQRSTRSCSSPWMSSSACSASPKPFKRANRKFHPEDSVIDCGHGVKIGGSRFQVIAGPCSVEGGTSSHRPPREGRRCHDAARWCLQTPPPLRLPGHGPRRPRPAVRGVRRNSTCRCVTEMRGPARRAGLLGQKIDVVQMRRHSARTSSTQELGRPDPDSCQARHVRHDR